MAFPEYFAAVKPLIVYDPLAKLLGAPEDGVITYEFADVVKLAGHACPTVAGAWLLTVRGLQALYGEELPQRGQIAVNLPDHENCGVSGVIASVAGMLTGAAGEGGFKGLGGQHVRRGLLRFGIDGCFAVNEPGIGMVEAETEREGKIRHERRYYLSSASLDAATFARAVRGHWGIENRLHWVLGRRLQGRPRPAPQRPRAHQHGGREAHGREPAAPGQADQLAQEPPQARRLEHRLPGKPHPPERVNRRSPDCPAQLQRSPAVSSTQHA